MQTYRFFARDANGTLHVDDVQKDREPEVYAYIESLNLTPSRVDRIENTQATWKIKWRKEKILLFNELATYKRAGNISAREMAQDILEIFPRDKQWFTIAAGFLEDISKNRKIYQAMAERPKVFAEHEIQLMRIASDVGKEVEMLQTLARYLRRSDRVLNKIWLTMFYPAILVGGMIVSTSIYAFIMIPQLLRLYQTLNIDPAWPLPWIFATVDFLSTPMGWLSVLFSTIALACALFITLRHPKAALYLDRFTLNIPMFGELLFLQRLTRTLFILDLMVSASQKKMAFESAYLSTSGAVFREALKRCRDASTAGEVINKWDKIFALAPEIFNVTLVGLMRSGERVGNIGPKLKDALLLYEERIDEIITVLPERMQTGLTIGFAIIIGFFMWTMIVPTSTAIAHIH